MKKPYIICHMASTVDGRIISANWGETEKRKAFSAIYEQCHDSFASQAWMCGRVTMEKDFTKGEKPEPVTSEKPIEKVPFIGDKTADSFATAVDANGKLGWKSNEISGDHIITILTEQVGDDYLNYLQQKGVSYIFAGADEVDFSLALSQLSENFPIKTIMLEGGGNINGSLLAEGLIDELSLLILPLADGTPETPTTFEIGECLPKKPSTQLKLIDVTQMEEDVLWLKYKIVESS